MVTYLSLILIVPIVGAVLLVLFEQLRKYLKKMGISTDCLNHIFANVVALTVFVLAIISIFVDNFKDLNTTADHLLEFGKYGNLEAILISIFSFLVLMAVLFSVDYMKGKNGLGYYYALILT
ncbi:MAG: hypothetical protein KAS95_09780, partial [Candidatus Heimdallarchaeota archaeon]|nr:hypothetical protein [Candidatus Heimdallarchaeota archaeon]